MPWHFCLNYSLSYCFLHLFSITNANFSNLSFAAAIYFSQRWCFCNWSYSVCHFKICCPFRQFPLRQMRTLWERPEYCASWNIFLILGRPSNYDFFFCCQLPIEICMTFHVLTIIISEDNLSPDIFEVQEILWTMYWSHPLIQENIYTWIQVWSSLFYFFVPFVLLYWISLGKW